MPEALPSWCLLGRRVRTRHSDDAADEEKDYKWPLSCVQKKAFGFADVDEANELVQSLDLEAHLALTEPLDLSSLRFRGDTSVDASIHTTDRNLLILFARFDSDDLYDARPVFLIYDAYKKELIMIPAMPHKFEVHFTTRVLVARRHPDDGFYALVLTGKEKVFEDSIFLWSPFSPSRPWEVSSGARFPQQCHETSFCADECFSFNGCCYWADLHCGVMYCTTDALLSSNCDDPVEFSFIDLPLEPTRDLRLRSYPVAPLDRFRAIGFVQDSTIKFVSINGFIEPVDLEKRTVTVWRLQLQDDHTHKGWEKEGELSLKTLWGLKGFDLPKDLTLMFPYLSTEDDNVIYFVLGNYRVNSKGTFIPLSQRYLLCVDMRNKILVKSIRLTDQFVCPNLVPYDFTQYAPLMKTSSYSE